MGEEMGRNGLLRIFTLVSAVVIETSGRKRVSGFLEHAHFLSIYFFTFDIFKPFPSSLPHSTSLTLGSFPNF